MHAKIKCFTVVRNQLFLPQSQNLNSHLIKNRDADFFHCWVLSQAMAVNFHQLWISYNRLFSSYSTFCAWAFWSLMTLTFHLLTSKWHREYMCYREPGNWISVTVLLWFISLAIRWPVTLTSNAESCQYLVLYVSNSNTNLTMVNRSKVTVQHISCLIIMAVMRQTDRWTDEVQHLRPRLISRCTITVTKGLFLPSNSVQDISIYTMLACGIRKIYKVNLTVTSDAVLKFAVMPDSVSLFLSHWQNCIAFRKQWYNGNFIQKAVV